MTDPENEIPGEMLERLLVQLKAEEVHCGKQFAPDGKGPGPTVAAKVEGLLTELKRLEEESLAVAHGNLDGRIFSRTGASNALRSIQSTLRHIIWQANSVAEGNLSIQIYGLGELGQAFNKMAEALRRDREAIESKNQQLADQNIALETAYNTIDFELKIVADIQRSLLPSTTPTLEGYEFSVHYATASRAGGDYYDFLPLPEGRLGLLIADVSGHGAPAAVVMAMTRLLLHVKETVLEPPGAVLRWLNERLINNTLPGQFVTAFYGILDGASGAFRFASAGHNPPLLSQHPSGEIRALETESGFPLGTMDEPELIEASVEVSPGGALMLYTDGLTEAYNTEGEMYGVRRLIEVASGEAASACALKERVLDSFQKFTNGRAPHDDVTLVVIRREPV